MHNRWNLEATAASTLSALMDRSGSLGLALDFRISVHIDLIIPKIELPDLATRFVEGGSRRRRSAQD